MRLYPSSSIMHRVFCPPIYCPQNPIFSSSSKIIYALPSVVPSTLPSTIEHWLILYRWALIDFVIFTFRSMPSVSPRPLSLPISCPFSFDLLCYATFTRALDRGTQRLGSSERPRGTLVNRITWRSCEALGPCLTQAPRHLLKTLVIAYVQLSNTIVYKRDHVILFGKLTCFKLAHNPTILLLIA